MSNYSESQIAPFALEIIGRIPGIRTSRLIDEVSFVMHPDGEDLDILKNRSDNKFSQKVRNLKSHKSIEHLVNTTDEHDCQWFLR